MIPRLSIIIPVYNVKPYLSEALDSVLNQTYKNIEVILINDGSTDGSDEICISYAEQDERIRLIHQANKGLSGARNTGLDVMTGDIVAFLDSDDAYDPDYLNRMVGAMIYEQADLVVCKYTNHYTNDQMIFTGNEKISPNATEGSYDRKQALCAFVDGNINTAVWNKIYKRYLWEQIRFPDGHVYEDIDTTFRIFDLCKKVFVLNSPLYFYRQRSESITSTNTWENAGDKLLAYSHFKEFVENNTPMVFSEQQLQSVCHKQLEEMISFYARYSANKQSGNNSFVRDLRNYIMKEVRKAGVGTLSFRNRLAYRIICACPFLFQLIHTLSHFKRNLLQTKLCS